MEAWFRGRYAAAAGELNAWQRAQLDVAICAAEEVLRTQGQNTVADAVLDISTQFGAATREGVVLLRWGAMAGRLSPDEARAHAARILEAATAADSDAILVRFLTDRLGQSIDTAAAILQDLRQLRESLRGGGGKDGTL